MDILCFSETWLNRDLNDELIGIENFRLLRNDRNYGRGGGTCIYIRNRLKFDDDILPLCDPLVEIQGVHLNGNLHTQSCRCIVLLLVYRPPRGNSEEACNKIKNYMRSIPNLDKKDIILLGDFNWDVGSKSNGAGNIFVEDIMNEFGLIQLIRSPTRIGPNSATTIDLIFTNINNIFSSGCLNCISSDHYPIYIIKKREKILQERVEIRKRKMVDYDVAVFSDKLINLDWSVLELLQDVDEMWDMIYKGLLYELDLICPFVFIKVKKNRPVWFSTTLASIGRERDLLFDRYRRGGRKNNSLYVEAVKKRREFNVLVKRAKKDFFKEQLVEHRGNQNKFWDNMHQLMGRRNQVPIERVFKHGSDVLLELQESADEINSFFATIGDRTATSVNNTPFRQLDQPSSEKLMAYTPFTCESLLETLGELSIHKSSGVKDVSTRLLFDAIRAVPRIFVELCNRSLETGVFPQHCKVARIKAIPKKGDLRLVDNLRPISILSIIGKILEKRVKRD